MSLMDVARGAYVRSPTVVRRSLAPLVALIPTRTKFGPVYQSWRERIVAAAADPMLSNAEHKKALRALLRRAHDKSSYYRALLEKALGADFDYDHFEPADLPRLPVLTKTELREAGDTVLTVPRSKVDQGDTSGSNGERPFSFYLDRDRSAREMAFVYSAWSRVGFTEQDAKVVLRGFGLDPRGQYIHKWEPALRELRLSVFPMSRADVEIYLDLIDERGIRYLYGYPSAIELLCQHMSRMGRVPKLPLKGIMPISEPLFAHQRRTIATALGDVPIANFYGLSEKTLFATEGEDLTYSFEPLYGAAELVDDEGLPITELGKEGRLIGTGLLSTGMPFIRYDTEDRATLLEPATEANGQRVVTIDFTPENPRYFRGIEEYQFFQDTPGKCTIRYIPSEDGKPEDALRVASDLNRRTHGGIEFDTLQVKQLAGGRAGKRAFIDQRLDISKY
ncbi:MAG: phenylacetate--CoA ligase family protein [Alphaproteobacteria bacterium]|nr:MAG: phenylacetate--CoA ligase family protein [Alphaproteobacteria bacterium]